MSGGAFNYSYDVVNSTAHEILSRGDATLLHRAFADHLMKVSKALKALEWLYSGDTSKGSEIEPIRACMEWRKESRKVAAVELEKLKKQIEELQDKEVNG